MTEHTPTPWRYSKLCGEITGTDRLRTSIAGPPDGEETDRWAADAAHIVRAINAHETLVGALRRAIDRLECHAQWASDDVIRGYSSPTIRAIAENHESAAINDLRAALTLAEEE